MVDPNIMIPIRAEVPMAIFAEAEMWAEFSASRQVLPQEPCGAGRGPSSFEGDSERVWVTDKKHYLTSREIKTGIINGPMSRLFGAVAATK